MPRKIDPRTPMFVKLGQAIATWQSIEANIERAFQFLLEPSRPNSAAIVFAILNFRSKCRVVRELIDYRVDDPVIRDEWKKVLGKIETLARSRNRIVHWHWVGVQEPGDPDSGKATYVLTSSLSDHRNLNIFQRDVDHIEQPFKDRIDLNDLIKIVADFAKANGQLMRMTPALIVHLLQEPPNG
jgi:hypothetical protein